LEGKEIDTSFIIIIKLIIILILWYYYFCSAYNCISRPKIFWCTVWWT